METITREIFDKNPSRFSLEKGSVSGAPKCPFGNNYQWIGYDHETKTFVRFSKSVFKFLINKENNEK